MTAWTSDELNRIERAEELKICVPGEMQRPAGMPARSSTVSRLRGE